MIVDMHCHTTPWSLDSSQTASELISAAETKGLGGVAITDHYEEELIGEEKISWKFSIPDYIKHNKIYRKIPEKGIAGCLIGIEYSYQKNAVKLIKEQIKQYNFDFTIVSLHEFDGKNPVTEPEKIFNEGIEAFYRSLVKMLDESARELSEAEIIGHYDFFSRYAPETKSKILYRHAPDEFDRLFDTMIRNGQALEINTKTIEALRYRGYSEEESMPDIEILDRYRDMGGRVITLASDAHCPNDVGNLFPEVITWLKKNDFKSLFYYAEHVPHEVLIADLI